MDLILVAQITRLKQAVTISNVIVWLTNVTMVTSLVTVTIILNEISDYSLIWMSRFFECQGHFMISYQRFFVDRFFQNYRFSLSWSRLMPDGKTENSNSKGRDYYHQVTLPMHKMKLKFLSAYWQTAWKWNRTNRHSLSLGLAFCSPYQRFPNSQKWIRTWEIRYTLINPDWFSVKQNHKNVF